jgi:uncharacterized membrane protein YiaA
MAGERAKKRKAAPVSDAAEVSGASTSKERARKGQRIFLVVGLWAAAAIYILEPGNAAVVIGLAALLGLMYWRAPEGEAQPRRMLGAGAVLLLMGIGVVGIGPHEIGIGLTLLALIVLAFGIHTFGRLGPQESARGA